MSSYTEYEWSSAAPSNGESGAGLAEAIISVLSQLGVKRVCDLGCGNGFLAGQLAALGYDVTGVDASPSGVAVARQNHPQARFHCLSVGPDMASAVGEGEFECVVSSDVIEHLYRPSALLEAANAILPMGGHLVITTPYHGYWKNLALSVTGRMDAHFGPLWDGGHIKFFSVATLSELLVRCGFKVVRFNYYGRFPWLWKNMICHARKSAS